MRVRERRSTTQQCPYCHDRLAGHVLTCAGCQAAFHTECVEEGLTRCPTLGCGTTLRPSILDQPPVVFEAPQAPKWFWPAATVALLTIGLSALWTGEYRFPPHSGGNLALSLLGLVSTSLGGIGVASWLYDRGFDVRILFGLR